MNELANNAMKLTALLLVTLIATTTLVSSADTKKPPRKKAGHAFVECSTLKLRQGPVLLKEKPGGGFLCWSGPHPKKWN
jgi:hypothetical protein